MFKALTRQSSHTPLKITFQGTPNSTCVALLEQDRPKPRWANTSQVAQQDLNATKAIWHYPRNTYERSLLLQNKKRYKEDTPALFKTANTAVSSLLARKVAKSDVWFPKTLRQDQIELWLNTAILKNYKYQVKTKTGQKQEEEKEEEVEQLDALNVISEFELDQQRMDQVLHSAACALYARDLANFRGAESNPEYYRRIAEDVAGSRAEVEVLRGEELSEKGLNLLYSVGKGASVPAHLITLTYNGNPNSSSRLALVGKGVTFDTGGHNLKPTGSMESMYLDKSGACSTLSAFKWALDMQFPINLTCTLALAENAIGSKAYKPSDILTSLKGYTVEIGNTDAEGRLCLADAMTYVQQNAKPEVMVDLATLTGACMVALGEDYAGIFGNDQKLVDQLIKAGEVYEEKLWQLPVTKEFVKMMKGKTADLSNTGESRYAGASTAAAFLKQFVEKDVKWAHLDIAGPAMRKSGKGQFSAGGTGFGVQTLTRYMMENWKGQDRSQ